MVERRELLARIRRALSRSRVVALIGPRQCGKTTLARQIVAADSLNYFDLEDPSSLARIVDPMTALSPLRGVVVIDEVQRRPDLFPILRVLADRRPLRARFLILGSASPDLLRQSSESLAGRLETLRVSGFRLPNWARRRCPATGNGEDSPGRSWPDPTMTAGHGGGVSSRPSLNGTCRSSGSRSRRPHCSASGRCSPTITGRFGKRRIPPVRWAFPSPRCVDTSIS